MATYYVSIPFLIPTMSFNWTTKATSKDVNKVAQLWTKIVSFSEIPFVTTLPFMSCKGTNCFQRGITKSNRSKLQLVGRAKTRISIRLRTQQSKPRSSQPCNICMHHACWSIAHVWPDLRTEVRKIRKCQNFIKYDIRMILSHLYMLTIGGLSNMVGF